VTEFDAILGAFEKALELERELGVRTVECDRALLVPLRPEVIAAEVKVESGAGGVRPLPNPAPSVVGGDAPAPRPAAKETALVDFAFIAAQRPQGAAAELLTKMVAAMGYTLDKVTLVESASAVAVKPRARVYVVLGSDAFKIFAPGQRAALGMWTQVAEVPTVVTYSPARIISYFGKDPEGLMKAKRQIWSDLKSALARIGKQPPPRNR